MSGSSTSQPVSSHGWEATGALWNPVTMDSHKAVPAGGPSKTHRSRNRPNGRSACQVPGCAESLLDCKPYFKRHLVCQSHAVAHVVMLDGVEMRFCQQCAKFERLTAFDQGNRSCRFRLFRRNMAKQRGNLAKQQQRQQQEEEQREQPTEDGEPPPPPGQQPPQRQAGTRLKSRPSRAAGSGQDTDVASSPHSRGSSRDLDTDRHLDADPGFSHYLGAAGGEDWQDQAPGPSSRNKRTKHAGSDGSGAIPRGIGAAAALIAAATLVSPPAEVLAATEQLMAAAGGRSSAAQDEGNLESRTQALSGSHGDVRAAGAGPGAPLMAGLGSGQQSVQMDGLQPDQVILQQQQLQPQQQSNPQRAQQQVQPSQDGPAQPRQPPSRLLDGNATIQLNDGGSRVLQRLPRGPLPAQCGANAADVDGGGSGATCAGSSRLRAVVIHENPAPGGGGGAIPPTPLPAPGVPEALRALSNRPGLSHSERSVLESLLVLTPGPACLPMLLDSSLLEAQLQDILQEVMHDGGLDGFGWYKDPGGCGGAAAAAAAPGVLGQDPPASTVHSGSSLAAAREYLGLAAEQERRPGPDQLVGSRGGDTGGAGYCCLGAPPDFFGPMGDVGHQHHGGGGGVGAGAALTLFRSVNAQAPRLLGPGGTSGGGGGGRAGLGLGGGTVAQTLQVPGPRYLHQQHHSQRHGSLTQQQHHQHHPHQHQLLLHHSYSAPAPEQHRGSSADPGHVLRDRPASLQAVVGRGSGGPTDLAAAASAASLASKLAAGPGAPNHIPVPYTPFNAAFSILEAQQQQIQQQHLRLQQHPLAASGRDAGGAGVGSSGGSGGAAFGQVGHVGPMGRQAQSVEAHLRGWGGPAWRDLPQLSYESLRVNIRPMSCGSMRRPMQQQQPQQVHQHPQQHLPGGTAASGGAGRVAGPQAAAAALAVAEEAAVLGGGPWDEYDGKYDTVRLSYKLTECDPYSLDPSTQGLLQAVASEGSCGVSSSAPASIRPGCLRVVMNATVRADQEPLFWARAPAVLAAVQELAVVNGTGVVLQAGEQEQEIISVNKTGAEVALGSSSLGGSGANPGPPPVITRASVAAVCLGARGSIQVHGRCLASPSVEFWGRMQGVHYQLQVQYAASDSHVLVQLPPLPSCGLLVIEAASGSDAALLSDWLAVVVVPTERVAAEVNVMQGRLTPRCLRRLLVDLGSLLDIRPLLSQPVNGVCPVVEQQLPASSGGSKHTWRSSSFDQEMACGGGGGGGGAGSTIGGGEGGGGGGEGEGGGDVSDIATQAGVLDMTLSYSGTASTLVSCKATVSSRGPSGLSAGDGAATTDVSSASGSSTELSTYTAITAAARAAAAELSLYLAAFPGSANNALGRLHSVHRLLGCFDPSELLTNADDETVLQRVLGGEAARQLLVRAVTVINFFAQRALVDTALCAVTALSDLHRAFPDLLTADLVPQPQPGQPCLMHAAVRSRSLALMLALVKCGDVLGHKVSLAWRGPGGITPLHLLALLGWPHLVAGLQLAVPSVRELWFNLRDDNGISPAEIFRDQSPATLAAGAGAEAGASAPLRSLSAQPFPWAARPLSTTHARQLQLQLLEPLQPLQKQPLQELMARGDGCAAAAVAAVVAAPPLPRGRVLAGGAPLLPTASASAAEAITAAAMRTWRAGAGAGGGNVADVPAAPAELPPPPPPAELQRQGLGGAGAGMQVAEGPMSTGSTSSMENVSEDALLATLTALAAAGGAAAGLASTAGASGDGADAGADGIDAGASPRPTVGEGSNSGFGFGATASPNVGPTVSPQQRTSAPASGASFGSGSGSGGSGEPGLSAPKESVTGVEKVKSRVGGLMAYFNRKLDRS